MSVSRLLAVASVAALIACTGVQGRLSAAQIDNDVDYEQFEAQGLEQLEGRYGLAYPGYANWGNQLQGGVMPQSFGTIGLQQPLVQQQQQFDWSTIGNVGVQNQQFNQQMLGNIGVDQQNLMFGNTGTVQQLPINVQQQMLSNIGNIQQQQQMPVSFGNIGSVNVQPQQLQLQQQQPTWQMSNVGLASQSSLMPDYGAAALGSLGLSSGNVGALGAGGLPLGSGATGGTSKKTTMAQPIYAQAMVVPKIITQPIQRPHLVTQPIIQQQLIQQPIVETRQIIQPVIRRIVTQPIIRPEIYESTTVQPTLKQETIVQPHIIQQTAVTPMLQNQYEEAQPIQEKAKVTVAPTQVQPVVSGKKQRSNLGLNFGNY